MPWRSSASGTVVHADAMPRMRPVGRTANRLLFLLALLAIPALIIAGIYVLLPFLVVLVVLAMLTGGRIRPGAGCLTALFHLPFMFRRNPNRDEYPVYCFRVQLDDGTVTECELPGDLHGGSLQLGDRVTVLGTRHPLSRVIEAHRIVNEQTGAVTTGRVPAAATLSRLLLGLLAVAATIVLVMYLVNGGLSR